MGNVIVLCVGNYWKRKQLPKLCEFAADALNLAMESDASQDSVVVASQSSQCTVVKGPTGTGKSQVNVNLISNGLAKGKKLLLICQKKYALEQE